MNEQEIWDKIHNVEKKIERNPKKSELWYERADLFKKLGMPRMAESSNARGWWIEGIEVE